MSKKRLKGFLRFAMNWYVFKGRSSFSGFPVVSELIEVWFESAVFLLEAKQKINSRHGL